MGGGYLLQNIDLTEISLYLFFLFFAGLILYLRREDRREGYPLEEDTTGRKEPIEGFLWFAKPKAFRLTSGKIIYRPEMEREPVPTSARRLAVWPGAPLEPEGDPMQAGVGPGAYAQRAKEPDRDLHGAPKIVPLRAATGFSFASGEPKIIGLSVRGYDKAVAGVVKDVWVDRMEQLIRYLEVELGEAAGAAKGKSVLVPMTMAALVGGRFAHVSVDAVTAAQFAGAPTPSVAEQITLDEEERVCAYFGAGYLYATQARAEPLV